MDKFSNKYHPEFIPGTFSVYADQLDIENKQLDVLGNVKTTKDGKLLLPQPSDSPNDPLNWSSFRKYWHYFLVLFFTGFTAATSNSAGSAQDSLNANYGISYAAMNSGAGILFLSIGYGCLIISPTSSLYGRRLSYIICFVSSIIGGFWFGSAKRTSDTLWSQLFVGASESASEAVAQLSITDIFYQHNLGSGLTGYILAISVGTYLGPLIGGFEVEEQTFRAVGNVAGWMSCGALVVYLFGFEESYFDRKKYLPISLKTVKSIFSNNEDPTHILTEMRSHRTNTFFSTTHDDQNHNNEKSEDEFNLKLKTIPTEVRTADNQSAEIAEMNDDSGLNDVETSYWTRIKLITKSTNLKGTGFKQYINLVWINIKMMTFPAVILSGIIWGWEDALLTFYLTTEDDLYYSDPWNYSDKEVGIMSLPCLIGSVIGCFLAGTMSDYYVHWRAARNDGIAEAEYRLHFAIFPAIIAPAGYLMFGLGTYYVWDWRPIYVGLGFIGFGWGCSGDIAMGYLMDAYPDMVLEGMVGVSVINNTIGCVFTFVCSYWLDSAGTKTSYIVLAVLKFLTMVACIPFIIWGKQWRKLTKDKYIEYIEIRDGML